ncbi:flagellar basal body P-ring formation protein FlgA [Chitinibacter bivalviorum]|uniref:Flagella basal body P-ring formation protein FlgA n=1 Tax=Chitinibacter bivalviorum TaxID=2739434 RepID=A0A7H9BFZ3_9NEIS|nr:flagellar basal body P-ring formation chaperone FlgA [Chitinibacter bivalviorum]QLG87539.1 flagellar basal body P-ring formation protein FlgA [Chitinibacter bivalviorum]
MQKYIFALAVSLLCTISLAGPAKQDLNIVQKEIEQWLEAALANSPGVPSYSVNKLDPKLQLDACNLMEIGLPQGYRLIGKTMLRVKCIEGASWSINAPTQISMQVQYVTAARPMGANQTLGEADLMVQRGDLGTLPGSVILEPNQAIGRTLNTAVSAGQPIRKEQLRAAIVIQQNQRVKVVYREDGLEIHNEGIALSNAAEGAVVRVRVGGNLILSGTAQAGGLVEVGP